MKKWTKATKVYRDYLISRLADTQSRLSTFSRIGKFIEEQCPDLLSRVIDLNLIDKQDLISNCVDWKGEKLNSEEKQVFDDLYSLYKI